jgi:putative membrane protein
VERLRVRGRTFRLDLQRFLPAFVLAGYGVFIVSLFLRNVMTWYINPNYVAPTTLAGAALIGLAFVQFRQLGHVHGRECDCEDGTCCDPSTTKIWVYGLLAIPLVLAAVFPPRSLAAFSAHQRGAQIAGLTTIRGATAVKRVSLSVDTRSFTLQDWAGALSADPNPADYKGKPVVLTGMVYHDSASVPPGYIMVLRYQVTCCIADARPVGLVVKDVSKGALQDNQWVTVTGSMGATSYQGQQVAVVEPKKILPTKAGNPYMY